MIRYIMRHNWRHSNGAIGSRLYSIDGDTKAVEAALANGGLNEESFAYHEFVGIEIIAEREQEVMATSKLPEPNPISVADFLNNIQALRAPNDARVRIANADNWRRPRHMSYCRTANEVSLW